MPEPTPERETVLDALERLRAWPEIARSPQLASFLEYIVERTLEGNGQTIKAYSIAVDVLGRSVDFDPQSDPIVRVQARRLRALLDDYYSGPGRADPVHIILPVGRYIPEFRSATRTDASHAGADGEDGDQGEDGAARGRAIGGVTLSWFVLVVVLLGMAVASFAVITFWPLPNRVGAPVRGPDYPSVTVVEFQDLTGPGNGTPRVAGLAIELVTDLAQFETVVVRYGGGGNLNIAVETGTASDYVLTGIVRRDNALVQYSAILTDQELGVVVWNHTVSVPSAEAADDNVLDEVSRRFSLILGSPRGPLHADTRDLLQSVDAVENASTPYLCLMLFNLYRESGATADAVRVGDCLAALSDSERQSGVGLAIAGSLLGEQGLGADVPEGRVAQLLMAETELDRALGLAPTSAFVWEQNARLHELVGEHPRARIDYGSAIQLNPASGDALAAYARLLAFTGRVERARRMAFEAIEGTPEPPDWYFGAPALLALRSGNFEQAIAYADRYARADTELGPILAILAGQRGGDGTLVNRYLAQVLDVPSFRANGVLTRLRQRALDEVLLEQIRGALIAAGVPEEALEGAF